MKKFAVIFILTGMFAFTATSCYDKEHSGDNDADTISTTPAETAPPAQAMPDTTTVPSVDPAMDTSQQPTPKM